MNNHPRHVIGSDAVITFHLVKRIHATGNNSKPLFTIGGVILSIARAARNLWPL